MTGPQGPPGVPGAQDAAGVAGPAGPAGSAGAAGSGVTNTVTIAPPLLTAIVQPVGQVTVGSGAAALTFPVLAAEQAGAASAAGRSPGTQKKTAFHEFSFTKKLDKSSPNLFQLAATEKHI